MGDPKNPDPPAINLRLPLGCTFYPSDEQLVCYYLTHKNNGDRSFEYDLIKEIDLYQYNPSDLPDTACFRFGRGGRKRHWYFYAARDLRETRERRASGGFWKRKGPVRDVLGAGAGRVVVGTRKTFYYHMGALAANAVRTDWIMHEYALIDQEMASFVLCRVFVKSRHGNNILDIAISCCTEESVATVRHIGVQHDDIIRSAYDGNMVHKESSLDHVIENLSFSKELVSVLSDRICSGPTAEQLRSSGYTWVQSTAIDSLDAEKIKAILEEDYIELDDLLCPLPDIDS